MNKGSLQQDYQAQWEASMTRRLDELKASIQQLELGELALKCGGKVVDSSLFLDYWNRGVNIQWPVLTALDSKKEEPLGLFDTTMLMYYLKTSDGTPLAYRWVSFRELPGGAFYHRAFQGYSGDRMAKTFAGDVEAFHRAARALEGMRLAGLGEYAYAFQPLPRLRMAALLWPGDEDFPTRGSILFDAAADHYMVLDGLALLGSRLATKLGNALG